MRIGFTHYGYRLPKGQQYEEKKKEKTEGNEFAQIYREKIEEGKVQNHCEKAEQQCEARGAENAVKLSL